MKLTAKGIAEKYVYGKHDALTDSQEIKDMITDIDNYAIQYYEFKINATPKTKPLELRKQQFKVKIIKSSKNTYWYNDRIGEIFEIEKPKLNQRDYLVIGFDHKNYISAFDCEILK